MRAEELALSFEDLRLLLALSTRSGSSSVSELARVSGLSLQAAYPAVSRLRGRKYLCEERRRYSLHEEGREVLAILDGAHRGGDLAALREAAGRLRCADIVDAIGSFQRLPPPPPSGHFAEGRYERSELVIRRLRARRHGRGSRRARPRERDPRDPQAIGHVAQHDTELGRRLEAAATTGTYCR